MIRIRRRPAWLAFSLCLLVTAGCTGHSASSASHSPGSDTASALQSDYLYGSAINPFIAVPPLATQHPTIPAATARRDVQHPTNWPNGAQRNDLVAFGYGRVTAAAADSEGDTHGFRHRRLAWVGIYRSSTVDIPEPSCPVSPSPPAGYHLAQGHRPASIRLAVIVDAATGYQATWSNLGDLCPQLVPDLAPVSGRVEGTFLAVGGPLGASAETQFGTVSLVTGTTRIATVNVGPNGRFSLVAPAGNYLLSGHTPQFIINGREGLCSAPHRVRVRPGATTRLNVYCQRN